MLFASAHHFSIIHECFLIIPRRIRRCPGLENHPHQHPGQLRACRHQGAGGFFGNSYALIASAIIVYNGYLIFRPAIGEVMDEAPGGEMVEAVRRVALTVEGVKGLDKSLVRKMGFEYFVDLHVRVDGRLSVEEGHGFAHRVKTAILEANPSIYDVLVHIEPA